MVRVVHRLCRRSYVSQMLCVLALVVTGAFLLQMSKVLWTPDARVFSDYTKIKPKALVLDPKHHNADGTNQQLLHLPDLMQHLLQQQQQPGGLQRLGPAVSRDTEDSKTRMAARLSHKREYCRKRGFNEDRVTKLRYDPHSCHLLSEHPSTVFRPFAKIASTFWTRFYQVLHEPHSNVLASPYTFPLLHVSNKRCDNRNISKLFANAVTKPLTMIFVRDPFSRVYSAYVDKLVGPNIFMWEHWGKAAMTLDGLTSNDVQCGQNVTFRQFVRLVNQRLHAQDDHVIPMTTLCDVCKENYDVIGKMETFNEDLNYYMALLNISFKHDVQLSRDTKQDAIYDSVQAAFGFKKQLSKCISTPEIGRRIWRKLQLRGLITNSIDYPLGNTDLTNMTTEAFYQVALQAHNKSTDKQLLSQQKRQGMAEAFRSLSVEDIRSYVKVYRDDFEAFGYEKTPLWVFEV